MARELNVRNRVGELLTNLPFIFLLNTLARKPIMRGKRDSLISEARYQWQWKCSMLLCELR